MIAESVTILVIVLIIAVSFGRAKHLGYSLLILPLGVLPAAHLLARAVTSVGKTTFFGFRTPVILAFAQVAALVLTCALTVLFSRQIADKSRRRLYLLIMLTYSIIMGWAYIFRILSVLF